MQDLIIEAGRTERQYWRDVWRYRNLFYFLAWRDILVRYKQTVVGAGWSVIRPVLTMMILSVVFGRIAKLDPGGVPYPILVFCGLLPWQFFAMALTESGNSLVTNRGMITKIYFPRMVVPASSVITSFVDFLISSCILAVLLAWYRIIPGPAVLALPIFVLLTFATAIGAGLWVSTLMVRYRDFRFIVPFVVQFGLYVSPVAFASSQVPKELQTLSYLNPMAGIIDGFRWAILGGEHTLYWPGMMVSVTVVVVLIVSGIWYFRRTERTFADII